MLYTQRSSLRYSLSGRTPLWSKKSRTLSEQNTTFEDPSSLAFQRRGQTFNTELEETTLTTEKALTTDTTVVCARNNYLGKR